MNRTLLCFFLFVLLLATPACDHVRWLRPADVERGAPPRIYLAENRIDLGTAVSGDTVKREIRFRNIGASPLRIQSVDASCGCTVVTLDRSLVPSEKSASLDVVIDTAGKVGPVEKTVTIRSNDAVEPEKIITLHLFVQPPDHDPLDVKQTSIFEGECRRCHVTPGIGLAGAPLFEALCAMCHRSKDAERSPASAVELLKVLKPEELRSAIEKGIPGTSMPGFHQGVGGPLSIREIDSLVHHLHEGR